MPGASPRDRVLLYLPAVTRAGTIAVAGALCGETRTSRGIGLALLARAEEELSLEVGALCLVERAEEPFRIDGPLVEVPRHDGRNQTLL